MKNYDKEKEVYDRNYKQIEAMYYKGYMIDQMVNGMRNMDKIDVIAIIQVIEGRKHQRSKIRA